MDFKGKENEIKEELGNVLGALAKVAKEEGKIASDEIMAEDWLLILLNSKSYLDPAEPDKLDLLHSTTLKYSVDQLYDFGMNKMLIDRNITGLNDEAKRKIHYFYHNYGTAKRHVESVYKGVIGYACSADKSRHLLKNYLEYLLTENVPELPLEREYWHQECGTYQEWFDFIEQAVMLTYANNVEEYMKTRMVLSLKYIDYAKKVTEAGNKNL